MSRLTQLLIHEAKIRVAFRFVGLKKEFTSFVKQISAFNGAF